MASTGSSRALAAAIIMVVVSGCSASTASTGSTTSTSATSSPSATPEPVVEDLTGGTYLWGPFEDVELAATGPDGWFGYPSWALDGPEPVKADAPTGIGISYFTANGLYSDPCRWDWQNEGTADVGDVKVGPSVDDMVAGLRDNTFYTSSKPTPVTIDGYEGQEIELQLPDDPFTKCDAEPGDEDGHAFVFSGPGLYAQGPANRWHLYILDVDGTRLMAVILSYEGTSEADLDTARDVIETMDIEP